MRVFDDLNDVLTEAAAGPEIRRYLEGRGIKTIGTLALVAKDEKSFEDIIVAPLLAGWTNGVDTVKIEAAERPIATAVLLHAWSLARSSWNKALAAASPVPAPPATLTTTSTSPGSAADSKVPKTLPPGKWTELVTHYNSIRTGSKMRSFPVKEVLGAESVVAQLWHERHVSHLYTPLQLGEVLQHRSFTASGDINPLMKTNKKNNALSLDGSSARRNRGSHLDTTVSSVGLGWHQCLQMGTDSHTIWRGRGDTRIRRVHATEGQIPSGSHGTYGGVLAVIDVESGHGYEEWWQLRHSHTSYHAGHGDLPRLHEQGDSLSSSQDQTASQEWSTRQVMDQTWEGWKSQGRYGEPAPIPTIQQTALAPKWVPPMETTIPMKIQRDGDRKCQLPTRIGGIEIRNRDSSGPRNQWPYPRYPALGKKPLKGFLR